MEEYVEKKYCIKPGYILREIGGEYVIVPVDEESMITNAVMSPNDSAVFFWKVFQNPHTKEDAVRKRMQEYDVEEATIQSAVNRFLKDALKYKIIEEVA